jgi:ABC-2 type transport system permease protein
MSTFTAYLKKEQMESSRQSKYLILGAFFGFFALSTPIMLRLVPSIMESQMPGFPKELMEFDAVYSVQNYIKNIYQLGNMAVAFVLMGVLADERLQGKLVYPVSQGASMAGVVGAKLVHYAAAVSAVVFASTMLNYYYSVRLFPGSDPAIAAAARSAGLLAAYFATRVVIVVFASALFTKALAAGLAALVVSYVEPIVTSLPRWKSFVAYSLIDMANKSLGPSMGMMPGAGAGPGPGAVGGAGAGAMMAVGRTGSEINGWVLTAALIVEVAVMVLMTVWRMKNAEIAPGAGAQ